MKIVQKSVTVITTIYGNIYQCIIYQCIIQYEKAKENFPVSIVLWTAENISAKVRKIFEVIPPDPPKCIPEL